MEGGLGPKHQMFARLTTEGHPFLTTQTTERICPGRPLGGTSILNDATEHIREH